MNFLLWVIGGALAGWIASLIVGVDENMGFLSNVIVGIAGAFIGGWISGSLGMGETPSTGAERPTSLLSVLWAVVGAVILLVIANLIF